MNVSLNAEPRNGAVKAKAPGGGMAFSSGRDGGTVRAGRAKALPGTASSPLPSLPKEKIMRRRPPLMGEVRMFRSYAFVGESPIGSGGKWTF